MLPMFRTAITLLLALTAAAPALAGPGARQLYERALERERPVRTALARGKPDRGLLAKARPVIATYERVVRAYPRSGYCDNALWQGAELAADLWKAFGQEPDRQLARRLYAWLVQEYPHSSFVRRSLAAHQRLGAAVARAASPAPRQAPAGPVRATGPAAPPSSTSAATTASGALPLLRGIRHTALPNAVRVIVELDAEVPYHQQRIADPDRVFIDLQGVRAADFELPRDLDGTLLKQIRIGQHPDDTVRIVLDIDSAASHSVFALYSPYRLVVDMHAGAPADVRHASRSEPIGGQPGAAKEKTPAVVAALSSVDARGVDGVPVPTAGARVAPPAAAPLPKREPPVTIPAGPPAANLRGRFSLSRQLGLGVSRIVIDPGHGGKDPGARSKGVNEASVVLDVALRLEKLLEEQDGFEVVLTRRTDEYVPLEERTAIANRHDADLFLSIHANASRNRQANGIETYFLNFATSPDAEAVAARENAASDQTMHRLPDIVKAITLNNKLAESRDFATFVQRAMVERVRGANGQVRDLGVKQAPFVVLIGAGMPSILAEISFLTHAKEGRLLQSPAYRQRLAEALLAGVLRYQRSLKSVRVAQSD